MQQENLFPEISFHQDSNSQQPSRTLPEQVPSHIESTNMTVEDSSNMSISQLLKAGKFKKVLSLLETEFDAKQASWGDFDIKLVPILNQMTEIQITLAQYSKASALCEKSKRILQGHQEDPDYSSLIAHTLQYMALISRENQNYQEALDVINKSLALSSLDSLENIEKFRIKALILNDLRFYKQALQDIQRSLDLVNKLGDTLDRSLEARVHNTLGEIRSAIEDWHEAKIAYDAAAQVCKKSDLNIPIEMAKASEGFGFCLIKAKKSADVLRYAEVALSTFDDCLGKDPHPARIPSFLLLARYFRQQKAPLEVKKYIMRAVEEGEAFYGFDCEKMREVRIYAGDASGNCHLREYLVKPILETSTENKVGRELGNLYLQKCKASLLSGNNDFFGAIFPEAVVAIKSVYGDMSVEMAEIYEMIAMFYLKKKQGKKVIDFLGRRIEIYKEIFGDNHIKIAKAYLIISQTWMSQNTLQAALYCERALKIQVEFYGEFHPVVVETSLKLANAYLFNNECSKSLKTAIKVLKAQEKLQGEKIYEAYEVIGMVYGKVRDTKNSGSYFRKSYQMARVELGKNDAKTIDTKEWSEFTAEENDLLCSSQEVTECF